MASPPSSPTSVFASLHRKSKATEAAASAAVLKENREAAVREAKQHVRDVVRNDWSFDPPSTLWSSSSASLPSSVLSTPPTMAISSTTAASTSLSSAHSSSSSSKVQGSQIAEWRLREYASSNSEGETEVESANRAKRDPYRFENPNAIQASLVDRRRKRRAVLEEEMQWNPGLRFFTERRDVWTGAKKRRTLHLSTTEVRSVHNGNRSSMQQDEASDDISDRDCNTIAKEDSTNLSPQPPTEQLQDLQYSDKETQDTSSQDEDHNNLDGYDSDDSLIPVMAPFIPNSNCIRSSITPAIYASIYSKVILQGLTPTVPINLVDITKAMVSGWKADGQWPPKPTIPLPGSDVPARRKGQSSTGRKGSFGGGGGGGGGGVHASGVTNAVKKVFGGLSGHSFHLRRSSRSSVNGETPVESGSGRPMTEVPVVEETGRHY